MLGHILLLALLLEANQTVKDIIAVFLERFPNASIGHDKSSIDYCREKHLKRPEIYDQDDCWAESNPPQGKLPYLMGVYAKGGRSFAEIARLIRERFPNHMRPKGFSHEEAVEIAARTNGEYARFANRSSL